MIENIKLFLLDMDGTIYFENELIDGALDFINKLNECNIDYVFLTNNSSKSQIDYYHKLKSLTIPCEMNNIFTSGMAMGIYLKENYPNSKVYLVGTEALHKELLNYNVCLVDDNPDVVVIGFDRELTYEKLEKACTFIDNNAIFLATNPDLVCPAKNKRYVPDCGSMCQMITNATGKNPLYIGKPSPEMIYLLANKYNLNTSSIAMVGDRVYTDITAGFNAGSYTICVLSGESTQKTIDDSEVKPSLVVNSVKDLISLIYKK